MTKSSNLIFIIYNIKDVEWNWSLIGWNIFLIWIMSFPWAVKSYYYLDQWNLLLLSYNELQYKHTIISLLLHSWVFSNKRLFSYITRLPAFSLWRVCNCVCLASFWAELRNWTTHWDTHMYVFRLDLQDATKFSAPGEKHDFQT